MKEIKLRGFHKKRKQMHDIVMVDSENGLVALKMYDEDREEIYSEEELLKEVVLMLWTGLKDKKGVSVYEGDILSNGYVFQDVYWNNNTASFSCNSKGEKGWAMYVMVSSLEVVGNVFEDKELIGGQAE